MLSIGTDILSGLGVVGDKVPSGDLASGVTGLPYCREGSLDRCSERAWSSASSSSGRSRVLSVRSKSPSWSIPSWESVVSLGVAG